MPCSPRAAFALCALALACIALAGCGAADEATSGSPNTLSAGEREQLVERIKEEASPSEIAYLREHREELEAQAEGEAEYGEGVDGSALGAEAPEPGGEAEQQREFDEHGEVEARAGG